MMHSIFKLILASIFISMLFINCTNSTQPQPNIEDSSSEKTTQAEPQPFESIAEEKTVATTSETIATEAASASPNEIKPLESTAKKPAQKAAKVQDAISVPKDVAKTTDVVKKVTQAKEEIKAEAPPPVALTKYADHSTWNAFLKKNVSNSGSVDYRKIKSNKSELEAYLSHLSENTPENNWNRNEKMAYWINAYNAFTVKRIVDNYPLKSITDLDGGKTWDVKWIKLGGKTYSLNQIENEILRPQFGDARIHFAVNCAAKSCPPLLNRAFSAENLNSQLESQTKKFITNPSNTAISESSAEVSKIFEWYAADFGDLKVFLNKYSTTKLKADATVSYKEYDWSLNE